MFSGECGNSIRSLEEKRLFVKCRKKENCHLLSAYEVLCTQKQLTIFFSVKFKANMNQRGGCTGQQDQVIWYLEDQTEECGLHDVSN